eukprot:TRINITY_DN16601_c0_g1_i1.p1 TRINITY_DN16601_c0_g1~~TRINITY_DN16601_c0_g1_i1.p1  ORF type:complete len:707 (+),score=182.60 TRINITY_DN16601_c0_g1_i1:61-2181(+)
MPPADAKLPTLTQSASAASLGGRTSPTGAAELGRPASQGEIRPGAPDSPTSATSKDANLVTVKFRGEHGITFEGTRVTGSVLQAWMLGVRPGWTILKVAGQAVQTKEDIEENLQNAIDTEKRYEVLFLKGQGKFGTEAKEKAEKEKRQLAKLRKEFKFQGNIDRTEHRTTTYPQIERVMGFLEENCSGYTDHMPAKLSKTSGKPLRMDFLNFYHLSNYIILPLTKPRKTAFVEMLTNQGQPASWFLSHWWGGPMVNFVDCLKKHMSTRGLPLDSAYWIWAFACRPHQQQCEITDDPKKVPFFKALDNTKYHVLLVLDPQATAFKRIWCCYETSLCLDQARASIDVATSNGGTAELLTAGLTEEEEKLELHNSGRGVRAKCARESSFPIEILEAGLNIQLDKAEAWKEEDKSLIMKSIAQLSHHEEEQASCAEAELRLKAFFAVALWSRATVGEKAERTMVMRRRLMKAASALQSDTTRKCLNMHADGLDRECFRTLAENLPPNLHDLNLSLRCSSMKDEDMDVLAQAIPKQMKELRLDFTRCENLSDAGVSKLAKHLNFEETAVYFKLAETKVSKDVQDWYTAEAQKNEENAGHGQLKNVSRALGMSLCLDPESAENYRQKAVPAVSLLGKVIASDGEGRAVAALRALNSFGGKARAAIGDEAQQRAKELEVAMAQAEADRKAKEAEKKAKQEAKKAKQAAAPAEG